jgi:phosphoketolase
VGQIYLMDNPLLTEPLRPEHVKPRLLGHWGTTPGQNMVYAHLNRVIRNSDLNMIYISGPGHGGPGVVASTYLEGTYTELYPALRQRHRGGQAAAVVLNDLDRFHLVMDVIDRVPGLASSAGHVRQLMADKRLSSRAYTREHGEDAPEITDWKWLY